ncbi:MAG: methionine--tRNA ligase [Treponemataceae bacterium]|nr:methionine--tRNA ligase [Treponemataceae bacterium]
MKKRLVTSALPYVNNIPHLGNLIQMLSADVFARFCRSRGYETLYVCGTDEYGTATETKAQEDGVSPRELCDHYFEEHRKIYEWFAIDFDIFGRTSNEECTEITQMLYRRLEENNLIKEKTGKQLFCPKCQRFLADRYVSGVCPKCGSDKARGDQCDACGALIDPTELKDAKCTICGAEPEVRETKHLYIDLPALSGKLEKWMEDASVRGRWSENAINITKAWIRDGLAERAITRDLKWGIPVPRAGYEDKVFYVWFNAPIGYISITKQLADELSASGRESFDWKSWWRSEASGEESNSAASSDVELFQFIGKDNIPFHTVIFPCTLLGSETREDSEGGWTKLFHMSSTEYLNYEDGKFSKSRNVGVFGSDAIKSGIPADAWRFYIFYNRPERQDFQFTWKDFQEKLNSELVGNLGNLVNRTLLFVNKYYGGKIPQGAEDKELWEKVRALEAKITENLEWANLKDAFHQIFEISDICNKAFQAAEPWKTRVSEPEKAERLIYNLCYVIKDIMIMLQPYLPQYARKVMSYFGKTLREKTLSGKNVEGLSWEDLGKLSGLESVGTTEVYFTPLDKKTADAFKEKFSGKNSHADGGKSNSAKDSSSAQGGAKKKESAEDSGVLPFEEQAAFFARTIRLKVAKIVSIERNPQAEKLYIEHLDDGSGTDRVIQSGLVPYLREDELLGKTVIIADNLAPRKMRGVESRGMLLAADYKKADGSEGVEVLDASPAAPGTEVVLEGDQIPSSKPDSISADDFFKVEINVVENCVQIGGKNLSCAGNVVKTALTKNGSVH